MSEEFSKEEIEKLLASLKSEVEEMKVNLVIGKMRTDEMINAINHLASMLHREKQEGDRGGGQSPP